MNQERFFNIVGSILGQIVVLKYFTFQSIFLFLHLREHPFVLISFLVAQIRFRILLLKLVTPRERNCTVFLNYSTRSAILLISLSCCAQSWVNIEKNDAVLTDFKLEPSMSIISLLPCTVDCSLKSETNGFTATNIWSSESSG